MRKLLTIFTALICAASMSAEIVLIEGLYYSLGTTTATVVKDQEDGKPTYLPYLSVTIPDSVTYNNYTYPVKTIGGSAFENCSNLLSVTLPNTITAINSYAFNNCSKLGSVNLPEGLTNIYAYAFYRCNLSSVTIPSTVTSIGNRAFQDNPTTSVTWLPVNCSIQTSTEAPFYASPSAITSFTFGDQVEIIPNYLCYKMGQLDTVVLPQNLQTIGNYAFCYCSSLKGVEIPASVTLVARNSFEYCTSLKSFTFPEGITTVATDVLDGCTALEEVFIPASVTTINAEAFYNCSGLMAIHNYAITPQTINENTVKNVNKQTCILYVPMDYIDLYRQATVWKDFLNIIGVATDLQFEEKTVNVTYLKQDSTLHYMEAQKWQVPHEPYIEGFTFVGWRVEQGMLADGIVLRAVYQSNDPTSNPEPVIVNPSNPAQKLIREGNVYILSDDKLYTIQGKRVQ